MARAHGVLGFGGDCAGARNHAADPKGKNLELLPTTGETERWLMMTVP